jgi:hypothetical protein
VDRPPSRVTEKTLQSAGAAADGRRAHPWPDEDAKRGR